MAPVYLQVENVFPSNQQGIFALEQGILCQKKEKCLELKKPQTTQPHQTKKKKPQQIQITLEPLTPQKNS